MSFAEPRRAVNKEGIVAVARVVRNGFRGGVKVAVAFAYDKGIERVLRVDGRGKDFRLFAGSKITGFWNCRRK